MAQDRTTVTDVIPSTQCIEKDINRIINACNLSCTIITQGITTQSIGVFLLETTSYYMFFSSHKIHHYP